MSRLKDYTSFVPLNQSIIILFSRHEENKENKDVTTIYKYGFNSLQDAVALAKVILRKKKLPKVESMVFNSDESSDVTSLEVDSYQQKYIENASKKNKIELRLDLDLSLDLLGCSPV